VLHAAAMNFREVGFRDTSQPTDVVFGYDTADVVLPPAADGSGPPVGARVTTFDCPRAPGGS
jgi:ribosomal protein S5